MTVAPSSGSVTVSTGAVGSGGRVVVVVVVVLEVVVVELGDDVAGGSDVDAVVGGGVTGVDAAVVSGGEEVVFSAGPAPPLHDAAIMARTKSRAQSLVAPPRNVLTIALPS